MKRAKIVLGMTIVLAAFAQSATAEITEIKTELSSRVAETTPTGEGQFDQSAATFPTDLPLPLTTLSQLVLRNDALEPVAAARAQTVFNVPVVSGIVSPNDVGMDLSTFTSSPDKGWSLSGNAVERRTVVFNPSEVSAAAGTRVRVKSVLYLSGVLGLAANDLGKDLSGARVDLTFSIRREGGGEDAAELLSGSAAIVGGAAGETNREVGGVVSPVLHQMIALDGGTENTVLLRALVFNALLPFDQYTYEYEATVGTPFDLVLEVKGSINAIPNGVGATLVLGLPQGGLFDIFNALGSAASGLDAQARIATKTDTSGQNAPPPAGTITVLPRSPFTTIFGSLCGTMGVECLVLGLGSVMLFSRRRRRYSH